MQKVTADELVALLDTLPPRVREALYRQTDWSELIEVVLDLGRPPEARFPGRELVLDFQEVSQSDIDYVISRVGQFSGDNRAGLERTLHRISAIRSRSGRIIGLTCRVGRAIFGTVNIIKDLIEPGKSVLLLGKPGIGKTTMLREVARVLADDYGKRVVVIDTSNEIAGDGDIPHPSIGHARRMQVSHPSMQHKVMIEAVENHMPEVIIIDEIGTELEAEAARTIAERGVQLIGTVHGNTLENLIMNPTLCDLLGGIQTVVLGDEEAQRRHTQKSVLERKAPPTFDVVVEILDYYRVAVHPDVSQSVDDILHSESLFPEVRWMDSAGKIHKEVKKRKADADLSSANGEEKSGALRFYLFGVNRSRLEQAARETKKNLIIVNDIKEADIFLTTISFYRRKAQKIRDAEIRNIPIYALKNNNIMQIRRGLETIYPHPPDSSITAYIPSLQRMLAERGGASTNGEDGSPDNSDGE
jgi:stage III sporulation protein SpoIIIAA